MDPTPRTAPPFLLTPPITRLRGGASLKDPTPRDLWPYPQVLPSPRIRLRPDV